MHHEAQLLVAVGVIHGDQLLAHLHLDRQLFAELAPDAVLNGFPRLLLAAWEFPQPTEETLLETMYDIPGRDDVTKVVVTAESVLGTAIPEIITVGADRRAS